MPAFMKPVWMKNPPKNLGKNLALRKPIVCSSQYSHAWRCNNLVDGKTNTGWHIKSPATDDQAPYATVSLQKTYKIRYIQFTTRNCCPGRNLGMHLDVHKNGKRVWTKSLGFGMQAGRTYTFKVSDVLGDKVTVRRSSVPNAYFNLMELRVYGSAAASKTAVGKQCTAGKCPAGLKCVNGKCGIADANVALNKPVSCSSEYGTFAYCKYLTDGNKVSFWVNSTPSRDKTPYAAVQLGALHKVKFIQLVTAAANIERNLDFYIEVLKGSTVVWKKLINVFLHTSKTYTYDVNPPIAGDTVRIRRKSKPNLYFQMAEIRVFGSMLELPSLGLKCADGKCKSGLKCVNNVCAPTDKDIARGRPVFCSSEYGGFATCKNLVDGNDKSFWVNYKPHRDQKPYAIVEFGDHYAVSFVQLVTPASNTERNVDFNIDVLNDGKVVWRQHVKKLNTGSKAYSYQVPLLAGNKIRVQRKVKPNLYFQMAEIRVFGRTLPSVGHECLSGKCKKGIKCVSNLCMPPGEDLALKKQTICTTEYWDFGLCKHLVDGKKGTFWVTAVNYEKSPYAEVKLGSTYAVQYVQLTTPAKLPARNSDFNIEVLEGNKLVWKKYVKLLSKASKTYTISVPSQFGSHVRIRRVSKKDFFQMAGISVYGVALPSKGNKCLRGRCKGNLVCTGDKCVDPGVNIAAHRPVKCSSDFLWSVCNHLTDTKLSSSWMSGKANEANPSATVKLASESYINYIQIVTAIEIPRNRNKGIEIQVLAGKTVKWKKTIDNMPLTSTIYSFAVPKNMWGDRVRIKRSKGVKKDFMKLAEVSVYGSALPTVGEKCASLRCRTGFKCVGQVCAIPSPNVGLNKLVSCSSEYGTFAFCKYLTDGNKVSFWVNSTPSRDKTPYAAVQLGAVKQIRWIQLTTPAKLPARNSDFNIEVLEGNKLVWKKYVKLLSKASKTYTISVPSQFGDIVRIRRMHQSIKYFQMAEIGVFGRSLPVPGKDCLAKRCQVGSECDKGKCQLPLNGHRCHNRKCRSGLLCVDNMCNLPGTGKPCFRGQCTLQSECRHGHCRAPLGTNIALKKAIKCSSEQGSCSKLIDGNESTGWTSASSDSKPSISVNLRDKYIITQVRLMAKSAKSVLVEILKKSVVVWKHTQAQIDGTRTLEIPSVIGDRIRVTNGVVSFHLMELGVFGQVLPALGQACYKGFCRHGASCKGGQCVKALGTNVALHSKAYCKPCTTGCSQLVDGKSSTSMSCAYNFYEAPSYEVRLPAGVKIHRIRLSTGDVPDGYNKNVFLTLVNGRSVAMKKTKLNLTKSKTTYQYDLKVPLAGTVIYVTHHQGNLLSHLGLNLAEIEAFTLDPYTAHLPTAGHPCFNGKCATNYVCRNSMCRHPMGTKSSLTAHCTTESYACSKAIDGSTSTYWKATTSDSKPYIRVTLDNMYLLQKLEITVPYTMRNVAIEAWKKDNTMYSLISYKTVKSVMRGQVTFDIPEVMASMILIHTSAVSDVKAYGVSLPKKGKCYSRMCGLEYMCYMNECWQASHETEESNRLLNHPVRCSSNQGSCKHLVDGKTTTSWKASSLSAQKFVVDMLKVHPIAAVEIFTGPDGNEDNTKVKVEIIKGNKVVQSEELSNMKVNNFRYYVGFKNYRKNKNGDHIAVTITNTRRRASILEVRAYYRDKSLPRYYQTYTVGTYAIKGNAYFMSENEASIKLSGYRHLFLAKKDVTFQGKKRNYIQLEKSADIVIYGNLKVVAGFPKLEMKLTSISRVTLKKKMSGVKAISMEDSVFTVDEIEGDANSPTMITLTGKSIFTIGYHIPTGVKIKIAAMTSYVRVKGNVKASDVADFIVPREPVTEGNIRYRFVVTGNKSGMYTKFTLKKTTACGLKCENGVIDQQCSRCVCRGGYSGAHCDKVCDKACLHGGQYENPTKSITPYSGTIADTDTQGQEGCKCVCKGVWMGPTCATCNTKKVACKHGKIDTKECKCKCEGHWTGPACNKCGLTKKNCGGSHGRVTSDCKCRCNDGYGGPDCKKCFNGYQIGVRYVWDATMNVDMANQIAEQGSTYRKPTKMAYRFRLAVTPLQRKGEDLYLSLDIVDATVLMKKGDKQVEKRFPETNLDEFKSSAMRPFYYRQDCVMIIDKVWHPKNDDPGMVKLKRGLAGVFSKRIQAESGYVAEAEETVHGISDTNYEMQDGKDCTHLKRKLHIKHQKDMNFMTDEEKDSCMAKTKGGKFYDKDITVKQTTALPKDGTKKQSSVLQDSEVSGKGKGHFKLIEMVSLGVSELVEDDDSVKDDDAFAEHLSSKHSEDFVHGPLFDGDVVYDSAPSEQAVDEDVLDDAFGMVRDANTRRDGRIKLVRLLRTHQNAVAKAVPHVHSLVKDFSEGGLATALNAMVEHGSSDAQDVVCDVLESSSSERVTDVALVAASFVKKPTERLLSTVKSALPEDIDGHLHDDVAHQALLAYGALTDTVGKENDELADEMEDHIGDRLVKAVNRGDHQSAERAIMAVQNTGRERSASLIHALSSHSHPLVRGTALGALSHVRHPLAEEALRDALDDDDVHSFVHSKAAHALNDVEPSEEMTDFVADRAHQIVSDKRHIREYAAYLRRAVAKKHNGALVSLAYLWHKTQNEDQIGDDDMGTSCSDRFGGNEFCYDHGTLKVKSEGKICFCKCDKGYTGSQCEQRDCSAFKKGTDAYNDCVGESKDIYYKCKKNSNAAQLKECKKKKNEELKNQCKGKSGKALKMCKKRTNPNFFETYRAGTWDMPPFFDAIPKNADWDEKKKKCTKKDVTECYDVMFNWIKKWGTGSIFAAVEAAYDERWKTDFSKFPPEIDIRFFAGGSAYVSVYKRRVPIIEGYIKIVGNLDISKCSNLSPNPMKADHVNKNVAKPDYVASPDTNVIKAGTYARVLHKTFAIGIKKDLCDAGDPCQAYYPVDPYIKDIGSTSFFSFKKTVIVIYVPVTFEVNVDGNLEIETSVMGVAGQGPTNHPNAKRLDRKQLNDAYAAERQSMAKLLKTKKLQFSLNGYLAPRVTVFVTADVGIGLPIGSAGIGMSIKIFEAVVQGAVGFNFHTKKDMYRADLTLAALGGRAYAYLKLGKCPFCKKWDITLFEWDASSKTINILNSGSCKACLHHCYVGFCNAKNGKCVCHHGWYGDHCHIGCPGLNQGKDVCRGRGDAKYGTTKARGCVWNANKKITECHCKSGFFGYSCHGVCPKSKGKICNDHGKCNSIDGKCRCDEGWQGKDCSVSCPGTGTTAGVCSSRGVCLITNHYAKCTCRPQYRGDSCEFECPIHNGDVCSGNGRCVVQGKKAVCKCWRDWRGEKCNVENEGQMYAISLRKPGLRFSAPDNYAKLTSYTFEFWVKPRINDGLLLRLSYQDYRINAVGGKLQFGVTLYDRSAKVFKFNIACTTTNKLTLGAWNHVAVTYNPDKKGFVSINGIATQYTSTPSMSLSAQPMFGATERYHKGAYVYGEYDELRVWSYSRTLEEVQEARLHTIGEPKTARGLMLYYRMDEGGGSSCYSEVGDTKPASLTTSTLIPIPGQLNRKMYKPFGAYETSEWPMKGVGVISSVITQSISDTDQVSDDDDDGDLDDLEYLEQIMDSSFTDIEDDDLELDSSTSWVNVGDSGRSPQRCRMSSEYKSKSCALCTDGKSATYCQTKKELNPWVEIDLGKVKPIKSVSMLNIQFCCQSRARHSQVIVYDAGHHTVWSSEWANPGKSLHTYKPVNVVSGRYVKFVVWNKSVHLDIADLRVNFAEYKTIMFPKIEERNFGIEEAEIRFKFTKKYTHPFVVMLNGGIIGRHTAGSDDNMLRVPIDDVHLGRMRLYEKNGVALFSATDDEPPKLKPVQVSYDYTRTGIYTVLKGVNRVGVVAKKTAVQYKSLSSGWGKSMTVEMWLRRNKGHRDPVLDTGFVSFDHAGSVAKFKLFDPQGKRKSLKLHLWRNHDQYHGQWIHICATFDGVAARAYLNGALVSQKFILGYKADDSQTSWSLGPGTMDEVRIWSIAQNPYIIRKYMYRPLPEGGITGLFEAFDFEKDKQGDKPTGMMGGQVHGVQVRRIYATKHPWEKCPGAPKSICGSTSDRHVGNCVIKGNSATCDCRGLAAGNKCQVLFPGVKECGEACCGRGEVYKVHSYSQSRSCSCFAHSGYSGPACNVKCPMHNGSVCNNEGSCFYRLDKHKKPIAYCECTSLARGDACGSKCPKKCWNAYPSKKCHWSRNGRPTMPYC